MRNLDRDRRPVFVAKLAGTSPEEDDQGQLTGGWVDTYTEPRLYFPTVTIGHGYAWHFPYGLKIDYDRVVRLDDPKWQVDECDVMWIDRFYEGEQPTGGMDGGTFDEGTGPYASGSGSDGGYFDAPATYPAPTAPHDYIVKKVGRGKGYTILYVERVGAS